LKGRKVRVAGIGNALAGDDAIGLHVVEGIRQQHWVGVECIAETQSGPGLFEDMDSDDLLILVDACQTGASAGSVIQFSLEELKNSGLRHASTHGLGLADWFILADQVGEQQPDILIYGIEVEQCRMGKGLSDTVSAAIPALVGLILSDIKRLVERLSVMDETSQ
jgi:hydrogenase maturation protease